MIVKCKECGKTYDDTPNWTICPHNPLDVAHDAVYCRRHDLFNCYLCIVEDPTSQSTKENHDAN